MIVLLTGLSITPIITSGVILKSILKRKTSRES